MAKATAAQRRYWTWVVSHGCLVCHQQASIHHQNHKHCHDAPEVHIGKNHWRVVPLCKWHHQDAPDSYHKLSKNWLFYKEHGIDLVEAAENFLAEYQSLD